MDMNEPLRSGEKQGARTYDVVVVGGGGSGLAAAASAAEHGATVLLLEKQSELGGSTGLAVGSFTTSETTYQQKAGLEDSTGHHIEDASKFAPLEIEARNHEDIRSFFIRHSSETLAWLTDMGIVFQGPTPEPPNRVARMHNVVPGARAYIYSLQKCVRQHGGTIICGARVNRLIRKGDRVSGVTADVSGVLTEFYAIRGVVLAAGDYSSAPDLISKYKGPEFSKINGIYTFANGDGHRLSEEVGAQLINMDVTYGPELRFVPPRKKTLLKRLPAGGILMSLMGKLVPFAPKPVMDAIIKRELVVWQHPEDSLFGDGAILVNSEGRRFCNEKAPSAREIAISDQPSKIGYVLLDQRLVERYSKWPHFISTAPEIAYAYVDDYLRLRRDASVAGNLTSVGEKRGIPVENLEATVGEFNRYVGGKTKDPWGRTGDNFSLAGERWVLLGPAKAYFTTTEGSPTINTDMQVLDRNDEPIPGLFAVGQNGLGGQILWGHGLHIAWAITSGRLVGKELASA